MKKEPHIIYLLIKLAIYTSLAVFVFIYRGQQVEHLKPFIGALMLVYGVDGIAFEILIHHKKFIHSNKTYLGLIELIFGIVLLSSPIPMEHVCIIWATWSIIRESYEIKEIVSDIKMILPKILSGVESIVAIVFSILLLLNPGEHHAVIHLGLLTAELILNPLVVLIDEWIIEWREKNPKKKKETTAQ